MEEKIKKFIEGNPVIKEYLQYPKEELEIMRIYINLELIYIQRESEKFPKVKIIKTCINQSYNCLDNILSYRYRVDNGTLDDETLDRMNNIKLCEYCNCKNCIKKSLTVFIDEIDKNNQNNVYKLEYLDVIDYILDRKSPEFKNVPSKNFFNGVNLIDLMYVQIILEADLVTLTKIDTNKHIAEFDYIDMTHKRNNEYYINLLLKYYKNSKNFSHISIDINDKESIFSEKGKSLRIYKIASYYKYLIETEKTDIILKLRELLKSENTEQGIKIRAHYFIYKSFQKVRSLPYSKKTKGKIYSILNYILNYRYKKGTPFIPINILIYSKDKEGVETISEIIGEFMWFFGYLSENMHYYNEYMNRIILDKFKINELYNDDTKRKNGILLLHNFENLLYTDYLQQNLTLNILTDEMEKNNEKVCTIIYGERESLKQILGNYPKLSQILINLELEVDDLDINKIYELIIEKLEKTTIIKDTIKDKIYNYIKLTYKQSDIQNMEYVNKLYNLIILNMNNTFSSKKKQELSTKDIPEAYNITDLPTIMKDINNLVGLNEIKKQINDLIALLKYNKKANIDIKNFNLHMLFSGNPGTGKTTVGRLITDIFYNLGYINQNKLTEVTAKDLIAEYVGQTAGKTFKVVKSALGGVLFIDEAYSITAGMGVTGLYGDECIATLLKLMEDYKEKLIIIFAGYKDEMKNFIDANPGLVSRIGYKINFPNYTLEELTQIYLNLLNENKLKITDEALEKLKSIINEASHFDNFGNGRYIHNIFQKILIEHSKNIERKDQKSNLYLIEKDDIKYEKLISDNKRKKIGFE